MAKMRIFEIARSIQAKNKEIKSGDLVRLLNENGFDVKGANSNIEDKEIAFLLQTFNDPKKVVKILALHNTEEFKEEIREERTCKRTKNGRTGKRENRRKKIGRKAGRRACKETGSGRKKEREKRGEQKESA